MKGRVLVTGAAGFIAGYLIQELLDDNYEVVGIDNLSKYGSLDRTFDYNPNFTFVLGDAKDTSLLKKYIEDCDYLISCAARIGGISYFHTFAYDLLAENERIMASTFDAAIYAWEKFKKFKKIIILSSSMVFENTDKYPTKESDLKECFPPSSTYGFQKLACEYFAKGAYEQYELPYTIARPFNCVGIGERRSLTDVEIKSGNISLAMSHVVPDLVQKIYKGQYPLRIFGSGNQIRHYTYGGDLAKGIKCCMENPWAINTDFNISTPKSTTVLELSKNIFNRLNKDGKEFKYVSDAPFKYDVQMRIPDVSKAKSLLNFSCDTTLDQILDEVVPWVTKQIDEGKI